MANTPDLTSCLEVGPVQDDAILPVNPFLSVRYQFGMLLGVDDFDAAEAYPRGKMRLHSAWLHGAGVVWGFGVLAPPVSATDPTLDGEIQVLPGLALDRLGHELHLDQPACVDVGAWYAEQKQATGDPTLGGAVSVNAATCSVTAQLHIELRFRACLTRQVPAMSEPCDGATGSDTAYSRSFETVEIKLVPGLAGPVDDRQAYRYPRLRLLFGALGLRDPSHVAAWEQEVLDARATIATQAEFLAAFRKFAAEDVIAAGPGTSVSGRRLLFPGDEDAPVMLADLRDVRLAFDGKAYKMTAVDIHPEVRPSHVATSTIQELNCCAPGAGFEPSAEATMDAVDSQTIRLRSLTQPFDGSTVDDRAFAVSQLTSKGWTELGISDVVLDKDDTSGKTIRLTLKARPQGTLRMIARGTGPAPLMYAAVPASGGTPATKAAPFRGDHGRGTAHDGSDFVTMWEGI